MTKKIRAEITDAQFIADELKSVEAFKRILAGETFVQLAVDFKLDPANVRRRVSRMLRRAWPEFYAANVTSGGGIELRVMLFNRDSLLAYVERYRLLLEQEAKLSETAYAALTSRTDSTTFGDKVQVSVDQLCWSYCASCLCV